MRALPLVVSRGGVPRSKHTDGRGGVRRGDVCGGGLG